MFRKKCPLEERAIPFTAEENTVMDAVQQLPLKYRVIIHLYYIEGYSISEIGSLLGRKDSTVGSRMHRARAFLRAKLEEDFDV
jgi:RNA polymerase sigma-70 factor (ECF subfamily)